jgi:hypothetical protein
MERSARQSLVIGLFVGTLAVNAANASWAQVQRYEPSRPTVSPYLNLFRENDENPFLPNYHSLVRPLQQQYRINQQQQQILRQQSQALGQLQLSVQQFERREAQGPLVAPTGNASWFARPSSRSTFLNTSRYYSQSGNLRR